MHVRPPARLGALLAALSLLATLSLLAALGLPAALGLGSCSLYLPTMSVPVTLPELPPHWQDTFPEVLFQLEFPGSDNPGTTSVVAGTASGAAGPRQVELRLPKRSYLPVIARPCLPEQRVSLPCAGGVYPLDVGPGETLGLSWGRGPAAELLLDLEAHGLDLEHLNVPRLCEEMELRGGEDPWSLDLAEIAVCLASGQMRVTAIHLQPLLDFRLPAGPGTWFLESPLRVPCPADAEGFVSLQGVTPGFHRLFESGGSGRLDLFVSGQEVLWARRHVGLQPRPTRPRSIRPRSIRPRSIRPRSIRPRSIRPRSTRSRSIRPRSTRSKPTRPRSIRPRSTRSKPARGCAYSPST